MEPSVIFGSLKLARSIAEFAGLIETIGTKIDRLANAEFEAGFRALEQASISSSEKDSLLREARYRFNKAISLEKEETKPLKTPLGIPSSRTIFCRQSTGPL
jgi:hypothetical protein